MVASYALLNDVSVDMVFYIIEGESSFDPKNVGDMDIVCKETGKPVRARGLLQITQCYWPQISDAQAFDPEWSIKWALPLLKNREKCLQTWTLCRKYFR